MILFDIFSGSKDSQRLSNRTRAFMAAGLLCSVLLLPGCGGSGQSGQGGEGPDSSSSPRSLHGDLQKMHEKIAGKDETESSNLDAAAAAAAQIPEANVMKVGMANVHYSHEWPATTSSSQTVDVRARVEGTLNNFTFREGTMVREGQVLFTIDDAPYQAAAQSARADLAKAEANLQYAKSQVDVRSAEAKVASAKVDLDRAQQDVNRYKPLAANGTISQQTYDNAVAVRDVNAATLKSAQAVLENTKLSDKANIQVAQAAVEAAKAQLTQANLNIGYCTITSPVSGIIGKLNVTPGNLVGQPGNTAPLVSLSTIDPIYVNFSLSEDEYLQIMQSKEDENIPLELRFIMGDGKVYPHRGHYGMMDRTLDPTTGTMGVRIVFPNPDSILREGQYGRLRVSTEGTYKVVVVPQRAVMNVQNEQTVYVLGDNNTVMARTVKLGEPHDSDYIVTSGLKEGERIIVDGLSNVRPGAPCKPVMVTK